MQFSSKLVSLEINYYLFFSSVEKLHAVVYNYWLCFDLYCLFCPTVQLIDDASHHVYADEPEEFNRVVENVCNSINWLPVCVCMCLCVCVGSAIWPQSHISLCIISDPDKDAYHDVTFSQICRCDKKWPHGKTYFLFNLEGCQTFPTQISSVKTK